MRFRTRLKRTLQQRVTRMLLPRSPAACGPRLGGRCATGGRGRTGLEVSGRLRLSHRLQRRAHRRPTTASTSPSPIATEGPAALRTDALAGRTVPAPVPAARAAAGLAAGAPFRVAGAGGQSPLATHLRAAGLAASAPGFTHPATTAAVPVLQKAHGAGRTAAPRTAALTMLTSLLHRGALGAVFSGCVSARLCPSLPAQRPAPASTARLTAGRQEIRVKNSHSHASQTPAATADTLRSRQRPGKTHPKQKA